MWLSLRSMLANSGEVERAVAAPARRQQVSRAMGRRREDFQTRYRKVILLSFGAGCGTPTTASLPVGMRTRDAPAGFLNRFPSLHRRECSRFQSGLGDRDRGDACLQERAANVVAGSPGHFQTN